MGSILLFSDIHADIGALDAILEFSRGDGFMKRYGPVSLTVNMGDVLERGYDPGPVIDRLESVSGLESILGNHDEAFLSRIPVSGSDSESERAHEEYRATGRYERFFRGMGKYYVVTKERLYVVHGGPIDPCAVVQENADGVGAWIYTQPWQRISHTGRRYADSSGYHYLPGDAFDAVKPIFGTGFAIVCGHEHREAAYRLKGGAVEDVLETVEEAVVEVDGMEMREKRLPLEEDAAYLIRLGIAGPEGYDSGRRHFGVYTRKGGRAICLLSIPG